MNATSIDARAALKAAAEVAAGRADVSLHRGDDGHLAIRVTGCYPEAGRAVAMAVAERVLGKPDRETGLYPSRHVGAVTDAGFVAVWIS